MRTSMQRNNRCIWTSSIQIFPQNCSLQGSIGAESAQYYNTNTTKCGPLPCLHHHPDLWSALFKLNAALSMRLQITEQTRKGARVLPVQNDRLKHSTNKPMHMDTQTHSTGKYQPTPRRETMSRQCSFGWQLTWIATTVGRPARRGRPIATLQSATWQGVSTWRPGLQSRPQSDRQ